MNQACCREPSTFRISDKALPALLGVEMSFSLWLHCGLYISSDCAGHGVTVQPLIIAVEKASQACTSMVKVSSAQPTRRKNLALDL